MMIFIGKLSKLSHEVERSAQSYSRSEDRAGPGSDFLALHLVRGSQNVLGLGTSSLLTSQGPAVPQASISNSSLKPVFWDWPWSSGSQDATVQGQRLTCDKVTNTCSATICPLLPRSGLTHLPRPAEESSQMGK